MMKFIILKTSSLGDILHAFDVVAYLKTRIPSCTIDWVVDRGGAPLVAAHPMIDSVIEVDTKKWRKNLLEKKTFKQIRAYRKRVQRQRYDAAFDLQGNCKSAFLLFFVKTKKKVGFGIKTVPEWPNIFFTSTRFNPPPHKNIREDLLVLVKHFFKDESLHRGFPSVMLQADQKKLPKVHPSTALICPGARWINKTMPLSKWITFLNTRHEQRFLFVWGTENERVFCEKLVTHFHKKSAVCDKLSLPELQNLMASVAVVIAMDSLPLHLCATTHTPTISFFGPSSPQKYAPIGDQHRAVWRTCPFKISFEKRCPHLRSCKSGACLKE